jgi:hypothetical protein
MFIKSLLNMKILKNLKSLIYICIVLLFTILCYYRFDIIVMICASFGIVSLLISIIYMFWRLVWKLFLKRVPVIKEFMGYT